MLGVAQIFLWGGSYFLLPVLSASIIAEFNWPEKFLSACLSMSLLISGLIAPRVGKLIGQYDKNYILLLSGMVMAFGLMLLYATTGPVCFVVAWVVLGIAMGMGLYDALFASIGKKYGRVSGKLIVQLTLVSGFTTTLIWPLLTFLLHHYGWRMSCLIYGVLLLLITLPVHFFTLFKRSAQETLPADEKMPASKTKPQVVRIKKDSVYYLLVCNFSLGSVVMTSVYLYLIAFFVTNKLSMEQAVFMAAFLGPGQVSVRLLDTVIRQKPPIIKAIFSACLIMAGLILLRVLPGYGYIGVFLFGFGNGLRSILRGALPLKYYRKEAYPVAIGSLARLPLIAQALTPLLAGIFIYYWDINAFMVFNILLALLNIVPPFILLYWKIRPDKVKSAERWFIER
ncbi:MAG: MFS transporter [Sphingobacteriales bacterium]|nr:MAG: MFS transporter [Sphingobacteriales bacterium]